MPRRSVEDGQSKSKTDAGDARNERPFAGIPAYLNARAPGDFGISGARVTHVFCDERKDAEHVSALSLVPNIFEASVDRGYRKPQVRRRGSGFGLNEKNEV